MIKAIIFDFDRVIHNTLELAYNINQKIGQKISIEEYKDIFNGNIYQNKIIKSLDPNEYFELQNPEFKKLIIKPEIKEELLKLKKESDLFIVSSNHKTALSYFFKKNKIRRVFKEVLGWECHGSKVYKFKLLMKKHKFNKSECLFITDTLGDIIEAHKVGLKTIAVDFGFHERARLEKGKPFKIISDFKKLLPEIKKFN